MAEPRRTAPLSISLGRARVGDDGLTDSQRAERASRYRSTAGSRRVSEAEKAAAARALEARDRR